MRRMEPPTQSAVERQDPSTDRRPAPPDRDRSHRSPERAQTEPIAALVAVMALIAGIGMYAVYVGDALPGFSDRSPENAALDRIADDVLESGVYPAYKRGNDLGGTVEPDSLPYGRHAYVEVTIAEDGTETVVADGYFGADGTNARDELAADLDGPPTEAGVAERSVSVSTTAAEVRGGTLRVGVW